MRDAMTVASGALASALQALEATAAQAAGGVTRMPRADDANRDGLDFAASLKRSIDRVDSVRQSAEIQSQAYERGDPGVSLNDVMIDLQKGSIALNMSVQVRNRLVSAYREVMNMQV